MPVGLQFGVDDSRGRRLQRCWNQRPAGHQFGTRSARVSHRRSADHRGHFHDRASDAGTGIATDKQSIWGLGVSKPMNRRVFGAAAIAGTGALAVRRMLSTGSLQDRRKRRSRVAIIHQGSYADRLDQTLVDSLRLFNLDLRGKAVLLKPNLVESIPGSEVNTNPRLVGAAATAFLTLGANTVLVGEVLGHQRDTMLVLAETGLETELRERLIRFVDLNRDEVVKVPLKTRFTGLEFLWLPRTVLASDFVVSMPKVKTHHWAGVTLSMKNLFGIVPGMKYGWPKNLLHWSGIHESILDICATVPIHFVIADGITAMEGNGPLQGSARQLGKIVLADDPVAADATCARLMGFDPPRVRHLSEGGHFLGNLREDRIRMLAEEVGAPTRPFSVLPEFRYLLAVKS